MSRSFLLFVLALVVSTRSATADYRDEVGKDACRFVAQEALLGIKTTPNPAPNVALCNAHEQCQNFRRFIEQYGKVVPSLTCAKAAAPPKPDQFNDIFENACALVATGVLTKVISGNLQDEIALCNKHPNKQSCMDTKAFIMSNNSGNPGGLTCK